MNVKGFLKNALSNEPESSATDSGSGMSNFFSNTSRFLDSVQNKKDGLFSDITNKFNSIKLPFESKRDSADAAGGRPEGDGNEDDDDGQSSASEYGDDGDRPMYAEQTPIDRQDSVDSVDSLPEQEAAQLKADVKRLVENIFEESPVDEDTKNNLKSHFQRHTGRSAFAKEIKANVCKNKSISETILRNLADTVSAALTQCNDTDDYSPATLLMQVAFTAYHETPGRTISEPAVQTYLFTSLINEPIWQSMRFWNAAFFIAIQGERQKQSAISTTETENVSVSVEEIQDNAALVQISKFTWRMHALGISRQPCQEFLRKQANAENVSKETFGILYQNFSKLYQTDTDHIEAE